VLCGVDVMVAVEVADMVADMVAVEVEQFVAF
jgi:hypothetical protein